MSVEVARKPLYANGSPNVNAFDALDSSSDGTEEFIKSVKDSLQRGRYDTSGTNKNFGKVTSDNERTKFPIDDEADIDSLGHGGNSLTEINELPMSDDDDDSVELSSHPVTLQNNLLKVKQIAPGVEDLVLNYPNDNSVKNEVDDNYDKDNHLLSEQSNHCCVTKKSYQRRKTFGQLMPNNSVAEKLAEFLKKRSRSLTHFDMQDMVDARSSLDNNDTSCDETASSNKCSTKIVEDVPVRIPKKRCSSGESRNSVGGDSYHRYSEASTYSDSDSLRRRCLGWNRRFSNYSVATTGTMQTSLSSFIEPEAAVDLAENLMIELFDTDDIDGIIPARFLQSNQEAIVDNIREEEYSPSYTPSGSCDHSSFEDDSSMPHNLAGELGSELRFSNIASPHNTGSPRSSRHSKSSSPERTDISAYPIEGVLPRNSIFSNMQLDTVEEETASQISPSPRVMSPRISIDNGESFDALVDLHNKPNQITGHRLSVPYMRKISLQREHAREYHRFSVESMPVSENSFYFSVTSFDDDIVGKMEMIDDSSVSPKLDRRQRKMATVSTPNASVLHWLANMPKDIPRSIDPDEPWPFNEDVASSTAPSAEVVMETLAVPERKISVSETSDLDSFHSCRDDYASSNISGQDSFDNAQLDCNQTEHSTNQFDQYDLACDKDNTLHQAITVDQQPSHRRQRLKPQREAIDYDDY